MARWFRLERTPEAEVMDSAEEVSAYSSAAAQKHLDALDNTLVSQMLSLAPRGGRPAGRLLDLGCGPGGIAVKIAICCPELEVVGVDRSENMIRAAREATVEHGLSGRVFFFRADANKLCFPDRLFDFVISNSVLHHLATPLQVFEEIARVMKRGGVALVRDLRRPSRPIFPLHVRWHGRHYAGAMRRLFEDSVRAAYTRRELSDLLRRSSISQARVFLYRNTHLGFVYREPGERLAG